MRENYRDTLKQRTCADHTRVDDAMSGINIAQRDGLVRFLGIHWLCFKAMMESAGTDAHARSNLADMVIRIQSDLARLNAPANDIPVPHLEPVDALAFDYVLEGSRLGSQVLKRRWAASEDPDVLAADAYFSLVPRAGQWRAVCDRLSLVRVDSARADKITLDTQRLFDLFYRAVQTSNPCATSVKEHAQ